MKKQLQSILVLLFLALVVFWIFWSRMPAAALSKSIPASEFSTERALKHVEFISQKPHYVGSPYHTVVQEYLQQELKNLGLETTIQKQTVLSKWGNLVESTNVIARRKGNNHSKALLLLTHYDSAPHSNSYGASDDANGLGAILEGLRAFLHNNTQHKNDIIILFSDAEELGLNGAYAFASEHPWAKDLGLVINFEARGSKGPSMMLAETNGGNAQIIKGFAKAAPSYPVSNSLMYSVYKMLPNDTDLTAFREIADVPGFNLAYIDGHYHYHTEHDNFEHFSPESLAHQGSYLMPLLHYFSNADLANLSSDHDYGYFNTPLGFVYYPFFMNWIFVIITLFLVLLTAFLGLGNRSLEGKSMLFGVGKFLLVLLLSTTLTWGLGYIISEVYPENKDLLHGFPYNGKWFMCAAVALTLTIGLWVYKKPSEKELKSYFWSVLLVWTVLSAILTFVLPGAAFIVFGPLFGALLLLLMILNFNFVGTAAALLSLPTLFIFVPLIELFPIGLGLKVLAGSAFLTAGTFGLILPLIYYIENKNRWAFVSLILFIAFVAIAHIHGDFSKDQPKFNSLVFLQDETSEKSYWATYDTVLDDWTREILGNNPQRASVLNELAVGSKYNTSFSYMVNVPRIDIVSSEVVLRKDTLIGNRREIMLEITPVRPVNRIDVFAPEGLQIYDFKANGVSKINQTGSIYERRGPSLVNYYPIQNQPLVLHFFIDANAPLELSLRESSFDVLSHPKLKINPRPNWCIPMPFVLNDAVIVQKKITKEGILFQPLPPDLPQVEIDSLSVNTSLLVIE